MREIRNICRICEASESLVIDLQSKTNERIIKMLLACADIKFEIDDPLPKKLCRECISCLHSSYKFRLKCEYADQKLRNEIKFQDELFMLSNIKEETNAKDDDVDEQVECFTNETSNFPKISNKDNNIKNNCILNLSTPQQKKYSVNVPQQESKSSYDVEQSDSNSEELLRSTDEYSNVEYLIEEVATSPKYIESAQTVDSVGQTSSSVIEGSKELSKTKNGIIFDKSHFKEETIEDEIIVDINGPDHDDNFEDHCIIQEAVDEDETEEVVSIGAEAEEVQEEVVVGEESVEILNNEDDEIQEEIEIDGEVDGIKEGMHSNNDTFMSAFVDELQAYINQSVTEDDQDEVEEGEEDYENVENYTYKDDSIDQQSNDENNSQDSTTSNTNQNAVPATSTTSSGNRAYICDTCGLEAPTHAQLNVHKKTHGKNRHQCGECGRWFMKRSALRSHIALIHERMQSFECGKCMKKFTSQYNLDRHVRTVHNKEKPFACQQCGKAFAQLTILQQHYAVHTNERKYECDFCLKTYKTQLHLNVHKKSHMSDGNVNWTVKKEFICEHCGKLSNSITGHTNHVRTHTGEKPYECEHCGKRSMTPSAHQTHLRTHTGEKAYECDVCQKRFSFKESLRKHTLLHTGEKPYACDECSMTFRQSTHLKQHQLVHTGIKEHVCEICLKTFALRGNLRVHMRLHTGETPYCCTMCPKKFHDSNGLKRHRRTHNIVAPS